MSRTSQIFENPAVKSFRWRNAKVEIVKDDKGKIVKDEAGIVKKKVVRETGWFWYSKELEKEIKLEMPFTFVWLENCSSVMGYDADKQQGIYSNEVLNTKTEPLTVKSGNEIIAEGLYTNIKAEIKSRGAKYCNPVYALMKNEEDEYEVVRFLMVGSSRDAWSSFNNKTKNKTHAIVCYDITQKETPNGDVYDVPVLKYMPLDEEFAVEADRVAMKVIDPYFKWLQDKPAVIKEEETVDGDY